MSDPIQQASLAFATPGQETPFPFPPPSIEPVAEGPAPEHGFSAELIQRLKAVHQEVFLVQVDAEGDKPDLYFLFRKADRKVLGACAKVGMSDPMAAAAVLVENTFLEGPREAFNDARIFSAVAQQLEVVNAPRIARVKNL